MAVTIKANACLILTIGDDSAKKEYRIHEGDIVTNLKYKRGDNEYTVTGAVRVINAAAKNSNYQQTCPPESYFAKIVQINSIIVDKSTEYDADLVTITTSEIVDIESVTEEGDEESDSTISVGVGPQYQTLDTIVTAAEAGTKVKMAAGAYTPNLTINKSMTFVGPDDKVQLPDNAVENAAVVSGTVTVSGEESEVEFRGLTFTENARIVASKAKVFKFVNCRMEGVTAAVAKTFPINLTGDSSTQVVIEGCYFGENPSNGSNNSYNAIEGTAKFADGSSVSNNYFAKGCATHNILNIYGADENAVININNNHCELSSNMVRVGIKGEPVCTINMDGNSYDETSDDEYAGILLVQPYNKQTTTFANCTINLNNTTYPEGTQLVYAYSGANDTELTADNVPKLYVDGEPTEFVILH